MTTTTKKIELFDKFPMVFHEKWHLMLRYFIIISINIHGSWFMVFEYVFFFSNIVFLRSLDRQKTENTVFLQIRSFLCGFYRWAKTKINVFIFRGVYWLYFFLFFHVQLVIPLAPKSFGHKLKTFKSIKEEKSDSHMECIAKRCGKCIYSMNFSYKCKAKFKSLHNKLYKYGQ